ncbi:DUF1330 domain-containing protein [Streptomyces sp. sk2.1]|uniref:DUF1330 domain-containing protein n=1 Tax=Streptomyces sp. sk2.1 TaxID=2478959 RepID=UPI0011E826F8|nr:DUF1330 domain-containing protein [Streptomyces sp. sk2.1]TXS81371.1 DUF1330 domain-containing protein [Streptomyces sp. sk2.1]
MTGHDGTGHDGTGHDGTGHDGTGRGGAGGSGIGRGGSDGTGPVYALNLFDLADREEYLAYARRSPAAVARHGGRVVALGRLRGVVRGDIAPRQVLILVEWESERAFRGYLDDPALADLHPHRVGGTAAYVWHLFDRLEDLRPLLKSVAP